MNIPTQLSLSATPGNAPPQNLDELDLAAWLEQCNRNDHIVGYLHAQYVCKVFDLTDLVAPLFPADPGKKSKTALKKLARRGLLQHLELPFTTLNAAQVAEPTWNLAPASQDEIATLVDARLLTLGRVAGRGDDISSKTAWKVWTDAGGRCMFTGCGMDLSAIPLYNNAARIGYLAHIIASDPNGPRGTQADSHRVSDNPDNIMLMCDAHHRLIDSFAPADYTAETLYSMRQAHRDLVHSYMESLAYPRVTAITLHADLANIPTYFQESELIGAILATGRSMHPGVVHYIRRNQRDDRRTPEFWSQYLHEHQLQIQQLVNSFNGVSMFRMGELAVFPLHHIATLVLAGRIIGEARAVQVFQYHRCQCTWRWDPNVMPQPFGTFSVDGLIFNQAEEVFLTIELTAHLDDEAIPANLAENISAGRMPWVRITMSSPDGACIRHPSDLNQFMNVARRAINHIQDVMRARRVHLIAISPASTVFCFGQMLQAGHHPTYTIYDRAGRDTPFCEAFSISGHEVTAGAGPQAIRINIR